MVDTNCDPNKVEFPVPSNDDATKSIAIITNYITAAIAEGLSERQAEKSEEGDEVEEVSDSELKLNIDEEGGESDASKKAKAAPPKRRVPSAGAGGRKPIQKK
jgi:small subunit ribosomal protein S2